MESFIFYWPCILLGNYTTGFKKKKRCTYISSNLMHYTKIEMNTKKKRSMASFHFGFIPLPPIYTRQVEQKPGGRGRGREWATLGVHPLSWLLSNNRLEKVPLVSVPHTSSNRLLLSNQDKGCTPIVAHSLALPLGPALLNLWTMKT